MAILVQYANGAPGIKFPIDKPVLTIGRSLKNDICIPDEFVSKEHAVIEVKASESMDGSYEYFIRDLGSTNSIYVNNKEVTSTKLNDNDLLRIGHDDFKFIQEIDVEMSGTFASNFINVEEVFVTDLSNAETLEDTEVELGGSSKNEIIARSKMDTGKFTKSELNAEPNTEKPTTEISEEIGEGVERIVAVEDIEEVLSGFFENVALYSDDVSGNTEGEDEKKKLVHRTPFDDIIDDPSGFFDNTLLYELEAENTDTKLNDDEPVEEDDGEDESDMSGFFNGQFVVPPELSDDETDTRNQSHHNLKLEPLLKLDANLKLNPKKKFSRRLNLF